MIYLIRTQDKIIDFEFMEQFHELAAQYREVEEGDPRLLCQASHATADYINDHLPEGLEWDNSFGIIRDYSESYKSDTAVEYHGDTYYVSPEAYEKLDELLPDAVEYGLKRMFGRARKYKKR